MPSVLIFGKNGQVGGALARQLSGAAVALDREEIDLADAAALRTLLEQIQPGAIINAAAYTAVDKAQNERALAFAVNADAPGVMARYAAGAAIPFVHYSTDYVFDGGGGDARTEESPVNPLNVYGASKRAGEEQVMAAGGRFFIFRTSWVYDARGANFFNTMLRLFKEREEVSVVDDQIGAPTYAPDLARATLLALGKSAYGLYHLCHAGETSWHGFAQAIFTLASARDSSLKLKRILAIPSSAYPAPAKRPLNSRLDCAKAKRLLDVTLPRWEEGLAQCMTEAYGSA